MLWKCARKYLDVWIRLFFYPGGKVTEKIFSLRELGLISATLNPLLSPSFINSTPHFSCPVGGGQVASPAPMRVRRLCATRVPRKPRPFHEPITIRPRPKRKVKGGNARPPATSEGLGPDGERWHRRSLSLSALHCSPPIVPPTTMRHRGITAGALCCPGQSPAGAQAHALSLAPT